MCNGPLLAFKACQVLWPIYADEASSDCNLNFFVLNISSTAVHVSPWTIIIIVIRTQN
jgi:hypothetical protein